MTPQERADKVVNEHSGYFDAPSKRALAEKIRVAIVEATNDELEKRRTAERALEEILQARPKPVNYTLTERDFRPPPSSSVYDVLKCTCHWDRFNCILHSLNAANAALAAYDAQFGKQPK